MILIQNVLLAAIPGLNWIDGVVVVIYLVGITVMGVWMGRRITGIDEFFMPRKFGKGMMMTATDVLHETLNKYRCQPS